MSSSFLEKVYDYIKANADGSSSGSSSGTSVSKTVTETTVVPFMKLTADQVNTFEGTISITYSYQAGSNYDASYYDWKVYVQILTYGNYIINPIFCVTERGVNLSVLRLKVKRIIHTDGDVLLAIEPYSASGLSQIYSITSLSVEGTTNSPTDYESLSSTDYTGSSLTESYYSTINYPTDTDTDQNSEEYTYLSINLNTVGINTA